MIARTTAIVMTLAASLAVPATAAAQTPAAGLGLVDAVRQSLDRQPEILTQREQVEISKADLQAAAGQFDARVSAGLDRLRDRRPNTLLEQAQIDADAIVTNQTSYSLAFQKQLHSGLTLLPSAQVIRSDDNLLPVPANRASVSITAVQPLARGRGVDVVTAGLRAGASAVRASEQDLRHVRSSAVLKTTMAYWNYVAAVRRLNVFRESEERSQQLADQLRALIDAGNRPAADIKQLQANLADRRSFRLDGEQALLEARHQLGLAMGLDADEIDRLPAAADRLPEPPPEDDGPSAEEAAALAGLAVARRADLAAIRAREEQADTLLLAARDQLKPQLNLQITGGYAGLDEGANLLKLFTPFRRQVSGLNGEIAMRYEWAGANSTALGTLERTDALRRQTAIARADITRSIRSGVEVALNAVRSAATRVRGQRDAASLYRSAIDDEREKQQLGLSTVIDLIVTEDRLTNSLLSELSAEFDYAVAVAQLRFQTDTLLSSDGAGVSYESLTTVPEAGR